MYYGFVDQFQLVYIKTQLPVRINASCILKSIQLTRISKFAPEVLSARHYGIIYPFNSWYLWCIYISIQLVHNMIYGKKYTNTCNFLNSISLLFNLQIQNIFNPSIRLDQHIPTNVFLLSLTIYCL